MNAHLRPPKFPRVDDRAMHEFQLQLNDLNHWRMMPQTADEAHADTLHRMLPLLIAENEFLERQKQAVDPYLADMPQEQRAFVAWFESMREWGPGQNDSLFPWLAESASLDEMKWFLTQEVAGEAGFEDLTAMAQVRFEGRPKLEMARNYWDEMGRGNAKGMHGPMLAHLGTALNLRPDATSTVWESLSLANTMAGLAANRHFAYHAVGALGAIELTAPGRAAMVAQGLKRLGVRAGDRHYFTLHSVLDIKHSQAWNEEVIFPLAETGEIRRALAEGALMRLVCGESCFRRYRDHLWSKTTGRAWGI
jgi:hypothetical protein